MGAAVAGVWEGDGSAYRAQGKSLGDATPPAA